MGGIAGVVRLGGDEAVVRAQLDRQLAAIPYRGEVVTRHVAGAAVLASIRRATDCAGSAEGGPGLAVVADARLDGRAALIDQLSIGVPAATLKDGGDARLILEAYRRWGEGCAAHLSGDFAFAVWDAPQRTLYLARDRTGVKQLYLHRDSTMLAFASEIRAVLAVPGVSRRLNRAALADHLLDVMEEAEATLFDAVTRLTPGHWLRAGLDGVRTEPYWALDSRREIRLGGDDQYAEAYRLALAESVGDPLRRPGRGGALGRRGGVGRGRAAPPGPGGGDAQRWPRLIVDRGHRPRPPAR
jgi:asparagine synthetase B (glutamine-hydrolysing)